MDENGRADLALYRSNVPDSAEFRGQVSREKGSKPNLGKSVNRGPVTDCWQYSALARA